MASMNLTGKGLRNFLPLLVIFLLSSLLFLLLPRLLINWGIDPQVMLVGNVILFAATGISFYYYYRSLQNNNTHVFMRMIYAGMFLKMLVCLVASVLYIVWAAKSVNKGALFGCMFLYLLYTGMEVIVLLKASRQQ